MVLIGRELELAALAAAWERTVQGVPQLAVIWGRRRVGKTFLLSAFAETKRAVYFTATRQDSEDRQLARFAERLKESLGSELGDLLPDSFADWEAALRFVTRLAVDTPLLVVLDEAPRLISRAGDFADVVSAVWENRVRGQKLMLVLSGSAVAVMEQMLGPQGGLHRRATVERRLDPFTLVNARPFLPDLAAADFIEAYTVCGGYPLHLMQWHADQSVDDNVRNLAFSTGALLLRDAQDIMSEDLDLRGGYERVLSAMAGGARRRSRIAGRAQQRIDHTLDRLRTAGYVRLVRSLGNSGSTDPLYEIADDYLAFCFTVLRDDADLIDGGQGGPVRARTSGLLQRRVSAVFEDGARAHAQRLVAAGRFPADTVVGRWWIDETVEIDVLGLSNDGPVLVGECKWSSRPVSQRDIAEVRAKAAHLTVAEPPTICFWSRGELDAAATASDLLRFNPDDVVDG